MSNEEQDNMTSSVVQRSQELASLSYKESFKHWISSKTNSNDSKVENELLSFLPFFPNKDETRVAKFVNTDIGNNQYIHEFYIENTEKPGVETKSEIKDIVIIHGYAAGLGFFYKNFDKLSSIPGIRIHAIDLLGFGFSSRPVFPSFDKISENNIKETENFFIDSLEEWRIQRNLKNFTLIGHSLGGYLSCCYTLKYNHQNVIDKLILVSPVGLERNKYSLLKTKDEPQISKSVQEEENSRNPKVEIEEELNKSQSRSKQPKQERTIDEEIEERKKSKKYQLLVYLWEKNVSPFSILRSTGPFQSKLISNWSYRRFNTLPREELLAMHNYCYKIFTDKGSGEHCITRILAPGALAYLPLLDRCPQIFSNMKLDTLWLYGDNDWMNVKAGKEMNEEINRLGGKSEFSIISSAGHHLYLDNPESFNHRVFQFLDFD